MKSKEEAKYQQLLNLGKALGVPVFEAFLELEVRDKDGKLINSHRQRSHSWVRNAYNALFSNLASVDMDDSTFGAGKLSGKDTGGGIRYGPNGAVLTGTTYEGTANGFRAAAAEDTWGILVGSGTNAESFEDYFLQTQIADGTGAGQLSHALSEAVDKSYTDTTWSHALGRYFNNNSGGTISVNEVALVARFARFGLAGNLNYLVSRDKLLSAVNVPDTGQLKVTYTIQLTYPS